MRLKFLYLFVFCLYDKDMKPIKQKRRGRPPKGSGKIKGIRLDVRLEEVEKQAFCAAAELNGLDLSAWIRERLRRAADVIRRLLRSQFEDDRPIVVRAGQRRNGNDGG